MSSFRIKYVDFNGVWSIFEPTYFPFIKIVEYMYFRENASPTIFLSEM